MTLARSNSQRLELSQFSGLLISAPMHQPNAPEGRYALAAVPVGKMMHSFAQLERKWRAVS